MRLVGKIALADVGRSGVSAAIKALGGGPAAAFAPTRIRLYGWISTGRLDRSHHHWRNCRWLAEQFMKSQMGLVMNIVLGIIAPPLLPVGCSAFSVSRLAAGSAI
jgi:hypothetical protein